MPASVAPVASPLVGRRLLALLYDALPLLGVWFLIAALFTAAHGDSVRGGPLAWLEFAALWLATGGYATYSWRRGGQTIGMRPWKLQVVDADGGTPGWDRLWMRYVAGQASLLLAGAGFWWAWLDRARLTWHDRLSGTRMRRVDQAAPG